MASARPKSKLRGSRWNTRDGNEPELLKLVAGLNLQWVEAGPLDGWVYTSFGCRWPCQWVPVEIKNLEQEWRFTEIEQGFIRECVVRDRPWFLWENAADVIADLTTRSGGMAKLRHLERIP